MSTKYIGIMQQSKFIHGAGNDHETDAGKWQYVANAKISVIYFPLNYFYPLASDMLGVLQSGIKGGHTVDLVNHWNLLDTATILGRSFLQRPSELNDTEDLRRRR